MNPNLKIITRVGSAAFFLSQIGFLLGCSSAPPAAAFSTPEDAVNNLVAASQSNDTVELVTVLGPDSKKLVYSGDDVEDRLSRKQFFQVYGEKNRLEKLTSNEVILHVGDLDWPFPIPIVKAGNGWHFDTAAGKQEILNRRIGRNELDAIQVCLAIVDAEREYAEKDRDGDGILEYAQQFQSTPGAKDGLYWPGREGEDSSPLGPLAARAACEGYDTQNEKNPEEPMPFHGYFYKILKGQGEHDPEGAYDYVVGGNMIGGFAILAYPAERGASGVMSFLVNHEGVVFQKDLGADTEKAAREMRLYDPDPSWTKVIQG